MHPQRQTPHRQFHYSPTVLARREKKLPTLSKKQLAAKERKRAKKAPKSIYDSEKMTLSDAVEVLRVRYPHEQHGTCVDCRDAKAVEVASPNATYELVVKTEMGKGSTIPKGRFNLPRETKSQGKDRILVLAEGRQAEEAKKAGADIVGGLELVEGVCIIHSFDRSAELTWLDRSLAAAIKPRCFCAVVPSSARLLLDSVECLVRGV